MKYFLTIFVMQISIWAQALSLESNVNQFQSNVIRCQTYLVEDKEGTVNIGSIISGQKEFIRLGSEKRSFGFSKSVFWLKVVCDNFSKKDNFYFVEIDYGALDFIDLFDSEGKILEKLGDQQVPIGGRVKYKNPVLYFNSPARTISTYYLRIQSEGSLQFPLIFFDAPQFVESSNDSSIMMGVFYGILIAMAFYNLFLFLSLRDVVFAYYVVYVLSYLFYQISVTGVGGKYIWPQLIWWINQSVAVMIPTLFLFMTLFTKKFLNISNLLPRLRIPFNIAIAFLIVFAALTFILPYHLATKSGAIVSFILPIALLVVGIFAFKRGYKPALFYIIAWCLFLLGIVLMSLRNLGVFSPNIITNHAVELGATFEVVLLSLGLGYRIRRLEIEAQQAKIGELEIRNELNRTISNSEKARLLGDLAKQVSHDIRSPLSALNMIASTIIQIPEDKRIVIRNSINRINDIANHLLDKGKDAIVSHPQNESENNLVSKANLGDHQYPLAVHLLSPIIDSIVSEKRILFREKQLIEIEADINQGYGIFANVNAGELKRVISNLLNNSIEAFSEAQGRVTVAVRRYGELAAIIIQDNGKGIPDHILAKLGKMGVSHGKAGTDSGSGLGVYHAKKSIEGFGGTLFDITSREGIGTTITMTLPQSTVPKWFVAKLELTPEMKIITLDDDLSVHGIWRGRLQSQHIANFKIEHLSFTSGVDFKSWFTSNAQKGIDLFLIDFELLNQAQTGLDIVEELQLGRQSILVTSRYEEEKIRERCEKLGVRLIPKTMAGFVPIEIIKPRIAYDAILIDDDELVHKTWQMDASQKNKKILTFIRPEDFFLRSQEFEFSSPIFIDSNLANEIRGEEVSKKIADIGFTQIYLCTGYEPSTFPPMSWLKGIVGKEPKFVCDS